MVFNAEDSLKGETHKMITLALQTAFAGCVGFLFNQCFNLCYQ